VDARGRTAAMQALGRRPSTIKPVEDASKRAGLQAQPAYQVSGPGLALCAPGEPTHFSVCSTTGARLKARPSSTQAAPRARHAVQRRRLTAQQQRRAWDFASCCPQSL